VDGLGQQSTLTGISVGTSGLDLADNMGARGFAEPDLTKTFLGNTTVRLSTDDGAPDWPKIVKHGISDAMVNVFLDGATGTRIDLFQARQMHEHLERV
jgi:hypothetical protein